MLYYCVSALDDAADTLKLRALFIVSIAKLGMLRSLERTLAQGFSGGMAILLCGSDSPAYAAVQSGSRRQAFFETS